jgi:hypothetical protein
MKVACQCDDGAHQFAVLTVCVRGVDERPVDLECADGAPYTAKHQGRNYIRIAIEGAALPVAFVTTQGAPFD